MKNKFFISVVCVLFFGNVFSQNIWKSLASKGDQHFENKDYENAIQQYLETLLAMPEEENSSSIYFNLGNAYFKNNELGKAILNYEKAKILAPSDADILYNLDVAKEKIKGDVIPIKPFFLIKWWRNIQVKLSSSTWAYIGIFLLWIGVMGLLLWLFSTQRLLKKRGFITGVFALTLSIFPFLFSWGQLAMETDSKKGILMVEKTYLRPNPDGAEEFEIFEGTELELLDHINNWSKVRLINSDVGWVKKSEYEKI